MAEKPRDNHELAPAADDVSEIELTDEDILDSMQRIQGYLDISTEDFRAIYHLAHRHAQERIFSSVVAGSLMRTGMAPLRPDATLDVAARHIVDSGYKGLPVVNGDNVVVGMLTETDYLRRLKAETFLELLLGMLDESFALKHRCHETLVSAAMTAPVVTVTPDAGFSTIMKAFHGHAGRTMPVVDAEGRLCGLLLRKDFLAACHTDYLP